MFDRSLPPSRRSMIWVIGLSLITIAITLITLQSMGRRWWCAAGDWRIGSAGIRSPHTSQHIIDPYTFTHVLHGFLFYAVFAFGARRLCWELRLMLTLALECGWEVVENSPMVIDRYRAGTIALGYDGDSVINSLGDIAASGLGFVLARWFSVRGSIGFVLVVELGLLLVYRDNLFLNVIMLLYSSDLIRAWQERG